MIKCKYFQEKDFARIFECPFLCRPELGVKGSRMGWILVLGPKSRIERRSSSWHVCMANWVGCDSHFLGVRLCIWGLCLASPWILLRLWFQLMWRSLIKTMTEVCEWSVTINWSDTHKGPMASGNWLGTIWGKTVKAKKRGWKLYGPQLCLPTKFRSLIQYPHIAKLLITWRL